MLTAYYRIGDLLVLMTIFVFSFHDTTDHNCCKKKGCFYERPRLLSHAQEQTSSQHKENLRTEINLLKTQNEKLTRRVAELEKSLS